VVKDERSEGGGETNERMKRVGMKPELQMPSSTLYYTNQYKCHVTQVKKLKTKNQNATSQ